MDSAACPFLVIESPGTSATTGALLATGELSLDDAQSAIHGGPLHEWLAGARLPRSGGKVPTVRQ